MHMIDYWLSALSASTVLEAHVRPLKRLAMVVRLDGELRSGRRMCASAFPRSRNSSVRDRGGRASRGLAKLPRPPASNTHNKTMVSAYRTDALRDPTLELRDLFASSSSLEEDDFAAQVTRHFSHVFSADDAFAEVSEDNLVCRVLC